MSGCTETSGFLFSHPCPNAPSGACQKCAKGVCAKHIHPTPQGYMCTTCAKKEAKSAKRHRRQWNADDDDSLLYGVFYYDHYGYYGRGHWGHEHLGDDFTEADAGSFVEEGGGDWEHDMGAS